jgi:hypothetical protein
LGGSDNWGFLRHRAGSEQPNSQFGTTVSIDNDQIFGGEKKTSSGSNLNQSSAYIFEKNLGGFADNWLLFKEMTASNGAAGDEFGISVAISRNHVVVGSHRTSIPS